MPNLPDLIETKQMLSARLLGPAAERGVMRRSAELSVSAAIENASVNVHAVGIGHKVVEEAITDTPCIRFYVVQKLPKSLLTAANTLPDEVDGIPTDVIESPVAFVFPNGEQLPNVVAAAASCSSNRRQRQRPAPGGISAAHLRVTAGTIACYCRSTRNGDDPTRVHVLSNNHVFADVNRAEIGDDLYQPGPMDGGVDTDRFAVLHRFVPIQLGGTTPNRVDAAIGRLLEDANADREICSIGQINGTAQADENLDVCKHGRTTGYTEGFVFDPSIDSLVGMDHNDPSIVALFQNQMRINVKAPYSAFGLGGDSGSLVLTKLNHAAVGLYNAGPTGGEYGLANRIQDVIDELEIQLL